MIYLNGFLIWLGFMLWTSVIVNGMKTYAAIKYEHHDQTLYFPNKEDS